MYIVYDSIVIHNNVMQMYNVISIFTFVLSLLEKGLVVAVY